MLANAMKDLIGRIRGNNYENANTLGLKIVEHQSHIDLLDKDGNKINKFYGHIKMSRFLKSKLNS